MLDGCRILGGQLVEESPIVSSGANDSGIQLRDNVTKPSNISAAGSMARATRPTSAPWPWLFQDLHSVAGGRCRDIIDERTRAEGQEQDICQRHKGQRQPCPQSCGFTDKADQQRPDCTTDDARAQDTGECAVMGGNGIECERKYYREHYGEQ